MREHGQPTWTVSISEDSALSGALFVRDALALSAPEDPFPLAEPSVPVIGANRVDRDAAEREWVAWLDELLYGQRRSARDRPVLTAAALELVEPLREWERQRRSGDDGPRYGGLFITEFVNSFEDRLGRPVRPFGLTITVVPVRGRFFWQRGSADLLASRSLLEDPKAFEIEFDPVVRALA
ncbi:hypothetical protein N8J89_04835 [Crossiella sp. CA-258035]|uniref:hypothetical protein n=1 Tax=Crossiella sp. CA-258035 TaxID=2981138 RepID=UPI0024BCE752|nr:hypothetical protein [Crossiella sp. CA-258035]WHT20397.1 hypothetical protein N8J89_04835 [Crossiella sp. CA-258035]